MKANKPRLTATAALALLSTGTLTHEMLKDFTILGNKGKGESKQPRGTGHKHMAYKRAMIKRSRRY